MLTLPSRWWETLQASSIFGADIFPDINPLRYRNHPEVDTYNFEDFFKEHSQFNEFFVKKFIHKCHLLSTPGWLPRRKFRNSKLEIVTARATFHKELRDEDHDDLWTLQLRQLSLGSKKSTGHGSNWWSCRIFPVAEKIHGKILIWCPDSPWIHSYKL